MIFQKYISNKATLILLNLCSKCCMVNTGVFQSCFMWNFIFTVASLFLVTLHAMRWQDLSSGKHWETASCGIFMQPQWVRSLDGLSWLRYNHFPEVNPDHKSGRHTSIFLLISNSAQNLCWVYLALQFQSGMKYTVKVRKNVRAEYDRTESSLEAT